MSSSKQEGGRQLLSSRILSRDRSSVANASFRVYYSLGAAGTVPFVWETKPGTPKTTAVVPAAVHDDDVPPMISPPPSYQSRAKKRCSRPPPTPSSSSSWPSRGGWMTSGWLNIRRHLRLSPSPCSSSQQQPNDRDRWLIRPDLGIDDDGHRRRPRRAILLCF